MNEGQIKTRIILIKTADYLLIFAVIGFAIYAFKTGEHLNMMMTGVLLGLLLVNRVGNFTLKKISLLKIELDKIERQKKKEF